MTNKHTTAQGDALTVRFRPGVVTRLQRVKAATGIPLAEQIRRAIDLWLAAQESGSEKGKR